MKAMKILFQSREGVNGPEYRFVDSLGRSEQVRTLVDFVFIPGRLCTTTFDIHGVGAFTRISWPVWMSLFGASLIVGSFGAA